MGIKALKEHFKIEHAVQIDNGRICIGSPYIHDIISIGKDFSIGTCSSWSGRNELLNRNFKDLTEASISGELKKIIEEPDTYENLITIWKSYNGKVIKKQCEVFEWPEVTTDGEMIYENTFFKTRKEALKDCRIQEVSGLRSIFRFRLRDSISKLFSAIKYTSQQIWYTIRAYLFFGY
ncbi:hypothetical protein KAR91_56045 [Candidatus Pacearchaeota archaeon]|nr:hypothetical protein [Candidatus Pacearchaeota archaeon]